MSIKTRILLFSVLLVCLTLNTGSIGETEKKLSKGDFSSGWSQFEGNPVVDKLESDKTFFNNNFLRKPQDPAIVKGNNSWFLIYNVGPYALNGWNVEEAESLEPLKSGINPFKPTDKGRLGFNAFSILQAPNDWVYHNGSFYAADSSFFTNSNIWKSSDLINYEKIGHINVSGSDPGLEYIDGYWHVFTEASTNLQRGKKIMHTSSKNIRGPWKKEETVMTLDKHTGDTSLLNLGQNLHLFLDYGPHKNYSIGHAETGRISFPKGWNFTGKSITPYTWNQTWNNPAQQGNDFGVGDADVAVENNTVYLFYERPIGVVYKDLEK